jgi:hypothetical protein
LLSKKQHAAGRHCEQSEAISNATMDFYAYHAKDCHDPSGLAMTSGSMYFIALEFTARLETRSTETPSTM